MTDHENYAEFVRKARLGDRECLNRLAETGRVRLHEYVFRLTLQEDLTQDIVQETILEMYKVFNKFKQAERFWDWLEGIAFNKVRSHYGRLWRHKTMSLSEMGADVLGKDSHDGLAEMVNKELKQIVFRSMQELEPRHRSVLALRCYKQMPYAQIARLMGCTEFAAQSLFYRAKKALAKKLSRHGLGKGYLLAALVLFGKMTATTEAAAAQVLVTAATLKVGVGSSLAALATSKVAVISVATVSVIGAGMGAVDLGANRNGNTVARCEGGSFFKGLGRPWMGLHTIDTVRRDAAGQQVTFATGRGSSSDKVEVVLTCAQVKLVYTIDMETDVIEKIALTADDGAEGELVFSYLQAIDNVGKEFIPPTVRSNRRPQQDRPRVLWLVDLLTNRW
jgi:RNA polymerase sigma factor (sigma-70 family)